MEHIFLKEKKEEEEKNHEIFPKEKKHKNHEIILDVRAT